MTKWFWQCCSPKRLQNLKWTKRLVIDDAWGIVALVLVACSQYRPSAYSLEIVKDAYGNKTRGGLIDRMRKRVQVGVEKRENVLAPSNCRKKGKPAVDRLSSQRPGD